MSEPRAVRQMPCPFCAGVILFDDAKQEITHSEPACKQLDAVCERFGLRPAQVDPAAWQIGADGLAHEIKRGSA